MKPDHGVHVIKHGLVTITDGSRSVGLSAALLLIQLPTTIRRRIYTSAPTGRWMNECCTLCAWFHRRRHTGSWNPAIPRPLSGVVRLKTRREEGSCNFPTEEIVGARNSNFTLPPNFPKVGVFGPKFSIFGQKNFQKIPHSQKFNVRICLSNPPLLLRHHCVQ